LSRFFGAFGKFQTATFDFVMSVHLSICPFVHLSAWNYSAPTGRIFMKFDICVFLEKVSGENSSSIKIGQE